MAGEFDLHQLLAGPIIAMNDAQGAAAASFYELFHQFAFEAADPAARGPRRLRMLEFIVERETVDGIERRQISLPLLQMIPIGGVGIESAKIEFTLAVNAEPASQPTAGPAQRIAMVGPVSPGTEAQPLALRARIAPLAGGESAEPAGNLKVEIQLRQVDLPAGLLDMIAETQGGMNQRVSDAAPIPDSPSPQTADITGEEQLFDAVITQTSARAIMAGREFGFTLEVIPNPKLTGARDVEISLAGEPKRAFEIVQPHGTIRVGTESRLTQVLLYVNDAVANYSPRTNVTLALTGTAINAAGATIEHRMSVLLPRNIDRIHA